LAEVIWVAVHVFYDNSADCAALGLGLFAVRRFHAIGLANAEILFAPHGPRSPLQALRRVEQAARSIADGLEEANVLYRSSNEAIADHDALNIDPWAVVRIV
jgi:hypothetical protein